MTTYDSTENLNTLTVGTLNVTGTANIPLIDVSEVSLIDGTELAPSLNFQSAPSTGIFNNSGNMTFVEGGITKMILSGGGVQIMQNDTTPVANFTLSSSQIFSPINMSGNGIQNLAAPVGTNDAVNRIFVESFGGNYWTNAGSPVTITTAGTYYKLTSGSSVNNCLGSSNWTQPTVNRIQWNGPTGKSAQISFSATLNHNQPTAQQLAILLAKNGSVIGPSFLSYVLNGVYLTISGCLNVSLTTGDYVEIFATNIATSGSLITALNLSLVGQ